MKPARWVLPLTAAVAACSRPPRADTAQTAPVPQVVPAGTDAPPGVAPAAPVTEVAADNPPGTPVPEPAVQGARGRGSLESAVPPVDPATVLHVRQVFQAGAAAGNQADVFAKVGDSITESASFLGDIGHGWFDLGSYGRLTAVVRYFSRHAFSADHEDNPFTRGSQAATAGWTTEDLLDGGDHCPLEQELGALHPAFAIVMIGTNDAARGGLPRYERNLGTVLDRIEAHHVVALVSTIPDEPTDPVTDHAAGVINGIIRRVVAARHLPLIDYAQALQGLPNHGLSDDHIHPSVYVEGHDTKAGVFTRAALAYGYNVRNLTALVALERMIQTLGLH